ncbi:MAG TPA: cupredoxin domain-containing protein [Burkholderiales bacterium]|nr:cupredoxin domain-containing protein [Burkholderiales bacterium]
MQIRKLPFGLILALPLSALAQMPEFTLSIKDHRFEANEITVPAGRRLRLVIDNQDPTPEEFESRSLRVEKVIPGGSKGAVTVGPLKPGSYDFLGEFHESSAKGRLHAK